MPAVTFAASLKESASSIRLFALFRGGPLGYRLAAGTWQGRFRAAGSFSLEKSFEAGIRVDGRRVSLHQPAGVGGRAIVAVDIVPEHAQHGHLLSAVMRGMGNAPPHHPSARPLDVEEGHLFLPPTLVFRLQRREPLAAVFRVAPDKFQASFLPRQRRRAHVNAEHVPEPSVLAHALVHHLLVDAPSARIALARTRGKLLVAELAPHADHLDSLASVRLDEEAVFHRGMPVKMWNLLSGKVV